MRVTLNTDGGVRTGGVNGPTKGSTGPCSIGYVVRDEDGTILKTHSQQIGEGTVSEAEYCNVGEAPVMMADFSYRPISSVRIGDRVMGWATPESGYRKLYRAEVLDAGKLRAEVVKITLASGTTIRCTAEHKWATYEGKRGPTIIFRPVKIGHRMLRVFGDVPPLSKSLERHAGYLGGVYDGEASRRFIAQYKNVNPSTHFAIGAALDSLGISHTTQDDGYRITGGRDEFLKFLVWCRPQKICASLDPWVDRYIHTAHFRADEVMTIEPDGEDLVYWLKTETGNYTAWGYASKNSAIIAGLYQCHRLGATEVRVLSDSQLVVNQLRGSWAVNAAHLREYIDETKIEEARFKQVTYDWIPRGQNKLADQLTREAFGG